MTKLNMQTGMDLSADKVWELIGEFNIYPELALRRGQIK